MHRGGKNVIIIVNAVGIKISLCPTAFRAFAYLCEVKTMKKLALITAAAMTISLAGCAEKEQKQEIAVPIYKADKVEYKTADAVVGDITKKYYVDDAILSYYDSVNVSFKTDGIVDEILAENGSEVKKGDILATLKTDDLEREIAEKELYLEQSKKTLATLASEGVTGSEYELAQTDVELEQMEYDHLVASRDDYVVTAPCDGVFGRDEDTSFEAYISDQRGKQNIIMPGVAVSASQRLGMVYDTSNQAIICVVYDADLENVNFGTRVHITQGDYQGEGKVVSIKEGENVHNYIVMPDEPDKVNDLTYLSCCFDVYSKLDVVLVPSKAVKTNKDRRFVNLLIDGTKVEQDVETGIVDGDNTEILSGLSGGEKVILD